MIAVVVELGDDGAHAVVAQAAGVVGRGDEAGAQGVHLGQGADHAGVAEVIGKLAPGKAGAGGRLHGDDAVVGLAPEHLAHEGGDQAAQVGAAAGAADDDVRLDAVLIQRSLGLQADDGLVQQNLVEDAAQHIAVALAGWWRPPRPRRWRSPGSRWCPGCSARIFRPTAVVSEGEGVTEAP